MTSVMPPLQAAGSGMALAALELGDVHADVDGMAEGLGLQAGRQEFLRRSLAQDRVAGVAILRDRLPFRTRVPAVVAAEASLTIQVADMVRVASPVDPHLGEDVPRIDLLKLHGRLLDGRGLFSVEIGIRLLIELSQPLQNR